LTCRRHTRGQRQLHMRNSRPALSHLGSSNPLPFCPR